MLAHSRLILVALVYAAVVSAQSSASATLEPLVDKKYPYNQLPYQVTGDNGGIRGPQLGYNICNSSTENQQSLCQTALVNNLADFCMWSSSQTNDTIGVSEAREVAWCTSPGHGARVIIPGTITGAQFLYAKNYIQVVGYLDQTKVGLAADDAGGELDPHGADEQGNPLGGVVYTNAFGQNSASFQQLAKSGNFTSNQNYTQVQEWIDFIGSGTFCLKMCNPTDPNEASLCNHIYDEIGCTYNALANYAAINGTFSVCDSDDMTPPGVYTAPNGQLTTWVQPASAPYSPPYTFSVPQSSNCVTYASTDLFKAAATDPAVATSTKSAGKTSSGAKSGSQTGSGAQSTSASGNSSNAPAAYGTDAMPFIVVGFATMITTMLAILA